MEKEQRGMLRSNIQICELKKLKNKLSVSEEPSASLFRVASLLLLTAILYVHDSLNSLYN